MMQKLKKFIVPIAIVVGAVLVFIVMKASKPEALPVEVKEKVWLVHTMEAKLRPLASVQTLYGTVESNSMVLAAAPVSGVVEEVHVQEGQLVPEGLPLVSINRADLQIPLEQAKAEVENASAQLKLQQLANKADVDRLVHEKKVLELKVTAVKRTKQLMKKNLASQSSLDAAEEALVRQEYVVVGAKLAREQNQHQLTQVKASLAKAKASLQQAELNLQRGELIAPYDLRIAKVHVAAGSRVNVGSTMVEFYGLDSMELRAKLPLADVPRIEDALRTKPHVIGYVQRSEEELGKERKQELIMSRLAGVASTSGVDALFIIPSYMTGVRPGDLLEVRLRGPRNGLTLALPYSAIYGNDRIYVVEEGMLQAKQVTLMGEVERDGELWALVKPKFMEAFDKGAVVSITHLPNAVSGLKIKEAVQ